MFDSKLMNFMWNGCRPKLKHNLLQSDKTEGGLPLVNLHKRDAAIKICMGNQIAPGRSFSKGLSTPSVLRAACSEILWLPLESKILFRPSFFHVACSVLSSREWVSDPLSHVARCFLAQLISCAITNHYLQRDCR